MSNWNATTLDTKEAVVKWLLQESGKPWLYRGQSKVWDGLIPSIDRNGLKDLPRAEKLRLERQCINRFRASARFFADQGERGALSDDIIALMVLRHYGVPTRLLDWSGSPHVAMYFALCDEQNEDGEIWAFDRRQYEIKGKLQWKKWKQTTSDLSGRDDKFDAKLTAFTIDERSDWFVCAFYPTGFPRQDAQKGAYSLTAQFGRNHADAIRKLLGGRSRYHRYIIPGSNKPEIREFLRNEHGIWRGSLFPDSAGAAETAGVELERAMKSRSKQTRR